MATTKKPRIPYGVVVWDGREAVVSYTKKEFEDDQTDALQEALYGGRYSVTFLNLKTGEVSVPKVAPPPIEVIGTICAVKE